MKHSPGSAQWLISAFGCLAPTGILSIDPLVSSIMISSGCYEMTHFRRVGPSGRTFLYGICSLVPPVQVVPMIITIILLNNNLAYQLSYASSLFDWVHFWRVPVGTVLEWTHETIIIFIGYISCWLLIAWVRRLLSDYSILTLLRSSAMSVYSFMDWSLSSLLSFYKEFICFSDVLFNDSN